MSRLIIKFSTGEIRVYSSKDKSLLIGDQVLVDSGSVVELGKIVEFISEKVGKEDNNNIDNIKNNQDIKKGTGKILRKLTIADKEKIVNLDVKAKQFLPEINELIKKHKLPMKLVKVYLSFDEKKLTVYFSSEGRVDFRQLVTDSIKNFKKLVRLQQIGTRDEAQAFGGFGKCGRRICCAEFLDNIESITLDMAKIQDLTGSISKISGLCGKLMCCLSYELEEYQKLKKKMPAIGSNFNSSQAKGKVVGYHTLSQKVVVKTKEDQYVEVAI